MELDDAITSARNCHIRANIGMPKLLGKAGNKGGMSMGKVSWEEVETNQQRSCADRPSPSVVEAEV